MTDWRPIKTAPLRKDSDIGPDFLAWDGHSMDVVHHAWDDYDGSPVFFNGDVTRDVTHWMPLPAPPV